MQKEPDNKKANVRFPIKLYLQKQAKSGFSSQAVSLVAANDVKKKTKLIYKLL